MFSVMNMLSKGLVPIGMLFFGPLSEIIRIDLLLIISGTLLWLLAEMALISRRMVALGWATHRNDLPLVMETHDS